MQNVNILLVEDNEGDILLTTEALEEIKVANNLTVARTGEAAIDLLKEQAASQNKQKPLPDLILLDVNLPRINGHEVLKYIKEHEDLKHIPVIMLTTSSSMDDISKSYRKHVNCYIVKPVESEEFLKAVIQIENFWFNIVKLPSKTD
ncbi:response regulator [Nonlabens agnitus]|uniref:Two-component system response regulator n=1 Tax=Nonlabens agnitus TaxID=870484 RepID=A0A2S9WQU1_9FLAO|nr:response regulator [Nonlabens agnitus]PRP65831.1 two-component system response regulator [Nonlabens agnitus]